MFVFFLKSLYKWCHILWNLYCYLIMWASFMLTYSSLIKLIFNCPLGIPTHTFITVYLSLAGGECSICYVCVFSVLCHEHSCTCVRASAGYRPMREIGELCLSFILYHVKLYSRAVLAYVPTIIVWIHFVLCCCCTGFC